MLTFIWQGLPPLTLGPYGTLLLTLLAAILAIITWRQRTWKSTADAAVLEMNVHKQTCERLISEKTELDKQRNDLSLLVAQLQATRDLKPLIEAVSSWISEGRTRFDEANRRLDVIHKEQTTALKAVLEEVQAQRKTSEQAFRDLTQTFRSHVLEDHESQIANKEVQLRFVSMMDSVERRLTQIAVQIGVVQWEKPHQASEQKTAAKRPG